MTVIRKGNLTRLKIQELLVGDIIVIEEGMDIPVDGILIEGYDVLGKL